MTYTFRVIDAGQQYELPDRQSCSVGFEFSDVGILNLVYAKDGLNYSRLGSKKVVIAFWDGVEVFDGRYVIQAGDTDDDPEENYEKFVGKSLMDVFRRVMVEEIASAPGQSLVFDAVTPGALMINLFTAAQARGAMTGITWDFTAVNDSNGTPWPTVFDIEYKLGLKYLEFMRNLVDQGFVEFRFNGTQLQAFIADTMGVDRSTGANPVELQAGLDYTELPRKWSSEEQAKFGMILGDDGIIRRRTDAGIADGPFGREEMAISQGGTTDSATLDFMLTAAMDRVAQTREQLTRKVIVRETGKVPSIDYRVSDYILERVSSGTSDTAQSESARYRIRSMIIDTDDDGAIGSATLVLNDKFLESQIRQARKVNGIIGGASAEGGGGNGVPVDDRPDLTTPAAPTGLISAPDTYVTDKGVMALVKFDWNPPTLNTDGSVLTDLKDYELQWRYSTGQSRRNLERNPTFRKTNGTVVLRRNLATNPGAEGAAGWLSNNGASWTHSFDTTVKKSGTRSVKSTQVAPGTTTTMMSAYNVGGGVFPVTAGDSITASVYVGHNAAVTANASVSIQWLDAALAQVGSLVAGTLVTGITGDSLLLARPSVTGVAPAGATQFRIQTAVSRSSGNAGAGDFAWADECLIEKTTTVNEFFAGSTTYKNLATGNAWSSLGGGTTVTPNVSFAGKKWTRVVRPAGGFGARLLVALADLQNGETYTVSATVYNETDGTITLDPQWCDIGGTSFTLQPKETRRIWRTASRATYDGTYRFMDIEFTTGGPFQYLVTDVLVEKSPEPSWFYSGTVSIRNGLQNAWAGTADASESTQTKFTTTYAPVAEYTATAGMQGWQVDPSGAYRINNQAAQSTGTLLGFDKGAASPAAAGKWYARRIKVRNIGPSSVDIKIATGIYGASTFAGWGNDGVLVTVPVGLDWIDVSIPAETAAPSGAVTSRLLVYANGAIPAGTDLEFKESVAEEVAGAGYEASLYFDGSSTSGGNFRYAWVGGVDDSFSDKIINTITDNNWRSLIVTDSQATVYDLIPDSVLDWQVRARDDATHVSPWAAAFALVSGDAYGPPAPSAPQLYSKLGTITVTWNGLGSSGESMPPDWDRVDVHMSSTSGFTPDASTYQDSLKGAGSIIVTQQPGGATRYFKFVSVDTTGNASEESAESNIVVNRIAGPDIEANTVSTNELAAGAVTAEKIALGVLSRNLVPDPSFEQDYIPANSSDLDKWAAISGSLTVAKVLSQARSGTKSVTVNAAAGASGYLGSGVFKVNPGSTYVLCVYLTSLLNVAASCYIRVGVGSTTAVSEYPLTTSPTGSAGASLKPNDKPNVTPTESTATRLGPDGSVLAMASLEAFAPPTAADPANVVPEDYYLYTAQYTIPAGMQYMRIGLRGGAASATSTMIDDVSLVELGVGATEATAGGVRLFDKNGFEVAAFVNNRSVMFSLSRNGKPVASITDEGNAILQQLELPGYDSNGDGVADSGFKLYGMEFEDYMAKYPKGAVAHGFVSSGSAIGSSLEIETISALNKNENGRLYTYRSKGYVEIATSGSRCVVRLKQSINGGAATQLCSYRTPPAPSANFQFPFRLEHSYATGVLGSGTYDTKVFITIQAEGGGNATRASSSTDPWELVLYDDGIYKGNILNIADVLSPPPPTKEYVSVWEASDSESYRDTNVARTDTVDLVQGYEPAYGNNHALILFNNNAISGETGSTLATAMTGVAGIYKVELFLYANQWARVWGDAKGSTTIRTNTLTALANTTPSGTSIVNTGWTAGVGKWVDITSLFSSSTRGIWIGKAPSTGQTHQGRFNSHLAATNRPKLRASYRR